jgi:hypothetical protein
MSTKIVVNGKKKPGFRDGSARQLYYAALVAHDGKTKEEFIKFVEDPATCPRVPKSGKIEKGSGWLNWFKDGEYVKLVEAK